MHPENLPEACRIVDKIENIVIRLRRVLNELTSSLDRLNCCFQEFNESLPPQAEPEPGRTPIRIQEADPDKTYGTISGPSAAQIAAEEFPFDPGSAFFPDEELPSAHGLNSPEGPA